jgi:hypothetical protein
MNSNTAIITVDLPSGIVRFILGNPFQHKQTVDNEILVKEHQKGTSGKGPHRDPRDAYILVATVAGIVICCTIGVFVGIQIAGLGGMFLGLVAGIFVGGVGGSYFGEYLKKRNIRKNMPQIKREDEGPFIK